MKTSEATPNELRRSKGFMCARALAISCLVCSSYGWPYRRPGFRQAGAMVFECQQTRDPGLACSRLVRRSGAMSSSNHSSRPTPVETRDFPTRSG